jgi:hypothetical protein
LAPNHDRLPLRSIQDRAQSIPRLCGSHLLHGLGIADLARVAKTA